MVEITKDTIIGDILDVAPQTAPIFLSIGMERLIDFLEENEDVQNVWHNWDND